MVRCVRKTNRAHEESTCNDDQAQLQSIIWDCHDINTEIVNNFSILSSPFFLTIFKTFSTSYQTF